MAVVAFTAHYLIACSAPEDWIRRQLDPDDLLAPMSPRFLTLLADQLGRRDDGIDLLLAARGLGGRTTLRETTLEAHPRVQRAQAHRDDVRVFTDPTGAATIILGRGLANRTEVAIEIEPSRRNQGIARQALTEARRRSLPTSCSSRKRPPATQHPSALCSQLAFSRSAAKFSSSRTPRHWPDSAKGRLRQDRLERRAFQVDATIQDPLAEAPELRSG